MISYERGWDAAGVERCEDLGAARCARMGLVCVGQRATDRRIRLILPDADASL